MLVILSPSKTQNFDDDFSFKKSTTPRHLEQITTLLKKLKKLSTKELQKILSVSENLTKLNYERYKTFSLKFTKENSRQALLSFRGDVYQGFELSKLKEKDFNFAQEHLRIISGLYGILRPLDKIQPYRLEMKTKLKVDSAKDLYQFWSNSLTKTLNKDIKSSKSKYLVNLASVEYFKAIQPKDIDAEVITVHFKEKKGKSLKTIALYAKQARGEMAHWIIKNQITSLDNLKKFKLSRYTLDQSGSTKNELLFVR